MDRELHSKNAGFVVDLVNASSVNKLIPFVTIVTYVYQLIIGRMHAI